MENATDKAVGKAEALNRINDIATELKQATFGMMLRTSDGLILEGYANLEKTIGTFLAKLVLEGKKFNLDENKIAAVIKEYLNAIPANKNTEARGISYDAVMTLNKRAAADGLIEKWLAMGVDLPDFVTSPSLSDQVIAFVWRAQRFPERRSRFTIELEVWNDRYTVRTHTPGRQFTSGVTTTSFEVEKLYERDFFEVQGLCALALHASEFNPLRSFNI